MTKYYILGILLAACLPTASLSQEAPTPFPNSIPGIFPLQSTIYCTYNLSEFEKYLSNSDTYNEKLFAIGADTLQNVIGVWVAESGSFSVSITLKFQGKQAMCMIASGENWTIRPPQKKSRKGTL